MAAFTNRVMNPLSEETVERVKNDLGEQNSTIFTILVAVAIGIISVGEYIL